MERLSRSRIPKVFGYVPGRKCVCAAAALGGPGETWGPGVGEEGSGLGLAWSWLAVKGRKRLVGAFTRLRGLETGTIRRSRVGVSILSSFPFLAPPLHWLTGDPFSTPSRLAQSRYDRRARYLAAGKSSHFDYSTTGSATCPQHCTDKLASRPPPPMQQPGRLAALPHSMRSLTTASVANDDPCRRPCNQGRQPPHFPARWPPPLIRKVRCTARFLPAQHPLPVMVPCISASSGR